MANKAPVILGFVVRERYKDPNGKKRERPASRRFQIRAAAEQFAELARKDGRDVYIEPVMGMDDV